MTTVRSRVQESCSRTKARAEQAQVTRATSPRRKNFPVIIPGITEQAKRSFLFYKTQPKSRIEPAAIVRAATSETGDSAADAAHAGE
jgi:hypothetical protein